MSAEEQAKLIAEHNKSEDKVAKMNEYCALDEESKNAYIKEYKKHHDDKKMRDHGKNMIRNTR